MYHIFGNYLPHLRTVINANTVEKMGAIAQWLQELSLQYQSLTTKTVKERFEPCSILRVPLSCSFIWVDIDLTFEDSMYPSRITRGKSMMPG